MAKFLLLLIKIMVNFGSKFSATQVNCLTWLMSLRLLALTNYQNLLQASGSHWYVFASLRITTWWSQFIIECKGSSITLLIHTNNKGYWVMYTVSRSQTAPSSTSQSSLFTVLKPSKYMCFIDKVMESLLMEQTLANSRLKKLLIVTWELCTCCLTKLLSLDLPVPFCSSK